jgi:hypothetical protein
MSEERGCIIAKLRGIHPARKAGINGEKQGVKARAGKKARY